mgnify:CR=1 FL=1
MSEYNPILSAPRGANKKPKRVGRGSSSGLGTTAGKGNKGQQSRSGTGVPYVGFEGGQMPIYRRLPKRGFNNIFAKKYTEINVSALNKFEDGAVVDTAALKAAGLVKDSKDGVKILANGELTKKLTVQVAAYSESAKAKIEAAGGKAEVI